MADVSGFGRLKTGLVGWFVATVVSFVFGATALAAIPAAAHASTTIASAATFAYDVPAIARVEAHKFDGAPADPAQVSSVREWSASPSVERRGTSTTPPVAFVATNTADDVLRLGTKDSCGNLNTLDDHFARHGTDFGATSPDDYARQASEFLHQPGTLTKIDPKTGVIRVYDPATEAFGAYSPTGTTRRFYIPDPAKHGYPTNLDYWNAMSDCETFLCPVCGYDQLEEPPWYDDSPSDEICPSCGTHFGFDDAAGGSAARRHEQLRYPAAVRSTLVWWLV